MGGELEYKLGYFLTVLCECYLPTSGVVLLVLVLCVRFAAASAPVISRCTNCQYTETKEVDCPNVPVKITGKTGKKWKKKPP